MGRAAVAVEGIRVERAILTSTRFAHLSSFSTLSRIEASAAITPPSLQSVLVVFQYPQSDRSLCRVGDHHAHGGQSSFQYPQSDRSLCRHAYVRLDHPIELYLSVSSVGSKPLPQLHCPDAPVDEQLSVSSVGSKPLPRHASSQAGT